MEQISRPRLHQYITRIQINKEPSNLMKDHALTGNRELELQACDCDIVVYKVYVCVLDRVTRERYFGTF